jgi:hypothetical protein
MSDTGGSKNPMPRPGVTDHENAAKHMHISAGTWCLAAPLQPVHRPRKAEVRLTSSVYRIATTVASGHDGVSRSGAATPARPE